MLLSVSCEINLAEEGINDKMLCNETCDPQVVTSEVRLYIYDLSDGI